MGFKLAIVVAPLEGKALAAFVDEVYGAPQILEPSDVAADRALYPDNQADRFALAHEGMGWIFDWDLITRAFARPLPVKGRAFAFVLHSVINWYGFAEQRDGVFVRCRTGDSDNGIAVDEGAPSPEERALVAALATPGKEAVTWDVWTGARPALDEKDEDLAHDAMGEEVVFGLMQHALGFRLDRVSPAADAFSAARVTRIAAPKSKSLLGRLLGRS